VQVSRFITREFDGPFGAETTPLLAKNAPCTSTDPECSSAAFDDQKRAASPQGLAARG